MGHEQKLAKTFDSCVALNLYTIKLHIPGEPEKSSHF